MVAPMTLSHGMKKGVCQTHPRIRL